MSNTTNYGIIGCGMMGHEHMHNIALLENARVAGVFEPDEEMAKIAQSIAPDAQMAASIDALLDMPELDCILIVSPNFRHVEQLEMLAAKRHLPVLVEKPLFTDIDQIERINTFANTYPSPVWVAMEYRYMPPITALLNCADDATGGIKMLTIREHRFPFLEKVGDWNRFDRYSGGTFVEKCCHFFDLMRLVLKSEPIRVMASGGQDANHIDERYNGEQPDILDNGYVIVDFANGSRALLELCMFAEGAQYQEEISAVGPNGKVEALVPGPGRFWPDHLGDAPVPQLIVSPRTPKGPAHKDIPVDPTLLDAGDHNGSTYYQHKGFLELVRGQRDQPDVSLNDGKIAVLMGMAAQISIREHRLVHMSELTD
ncbi:gfo/Idh/MocA family oxidoreductase [Loktanella sp. D2R18]|uniref:Gfo/Idh/MocA family protein n=1 Tax=Rhodobacterales TaxID=204455 RepID=UPI000DE86753|nr:MULTISPECIES: Gfo/Idh/MocA family oxidoreductase [Rhodobacterales]MDO6591167.1 Gfo/Idh/MocA family oxidoreductase [Yoonia sp. 1_MG-2023]RBW41435.1 gfo/Idh/MocA family oxidoreductase [Loktanella sp. D2R18]